MPKRSDVQIGKSARQEVAEQLDGVNARTQQRGPDRIRRKLEASKEEKANKRRKREAPTSATWTKH